MNSRTYYDVLGVSRNATLAEITAAKNALAKVYHPDANMQQGIDTTAFMQEILEAYRTLADPDKRRKYDEELGIGNVRVFRTYKVGPSNDEQSTPSFVLYWNAACRLQETVELSAELMEQAASDKTRRFFFFKRKQEALNAAEREKHLNKLSLRALQYITILKEAGIPAKFWTEDAMNWVLVRWGQRQNMDYRVLFNKYEVHLEEKITSAERRKIHTRNRRFHTHLKKLLSYAL